MKVIEHVPLSLAQGGPLLEYVSKDPDALTAALVTWWNPGHAPISATRLRHLVFRGLYTAREKVPAVDTDVAPEIQSQKVSHKIHKPISQFLPPHLKPSWDRLRTREVVAAFWALPNDVHAVLQAAQIPTAELIPLKFGLLAWASSVCLSGQFMWAPVASPPPLANKGMWTPDQLRPLLECSVRWPERGTRGPEWGNRPGFGNRGRDGKGYVGRIRGGLWESNGAGHSHSLPEHTSQVFKVRHLGRGEDNSGEDDGHEGQELWGARRR